MKRRSSLSKIIPMALNFYVPPGNACFMTTKRDPDIANQDLVCYKIIGISNQNPRLTYGPYTGTYYGYLGKESILVPSITEEKQNFWRRMIGLVGYDTPEKYGDLWKVSLGWIHTTWIEPDISVMPHAGTYEIWKCIIPKGTEYYRADTRVTHYDSACVYASKKIIFKKLILRQNVTKENI